MEKYNSINTERQLIKTAADTKKIEKELSFDFTLPDYQPEIKRLLRIGAEVLTPESSFGMNDCEFSGNVDYYVTYLGSDDQMYCAPLSGEYRISIPLSDGMGLFYDGDAYISCDLVSGRVTAKRKLTIRTRLCAFVSIYNNIALESDFLGGADPACTERLDGEVNAGAVESITLPPVNVTDEMIPDMRDGEIRVICAEGKVGVSECVAQNGEIICRGDIFIKLLMCSDGGNIPYSVNRKIPFSVSGASKIADAGTCACASGCVDQLSVTVDDGRIDIEAGARIRVIAGKNEIVKYTKDMYSTLCETECDTLNFDVMKNTGCFNSNITVSDTRSLDELSVKHGSRLVDICSDPIIESCEITGTRAKIAGRIRCTLIFECDGEYAPTDTEIPFVFLQDVKEGTERVFASCTCVNERGRIDGERIGMDHELYICASFFGNERIAAMTALHFGELIAHNDASMRVCYPSHSDSLWSVGRKYHISCEKLARDNSLAKPDRSNDIDTQKSLDGVKYLMICD